MPIMPISLETPEGLLYVRPSDIVALMGHSEFCGTGRMVRQLYLKGLTGPPMIVFDTPDNTTKIMDALSSKEI